MTICRQCGTRNPDDATYCASCGAQLREHEGLEPTIINISDSDDDSEVTIEEGGQTRSFGGEYVGQARVYVARGGNRGCLIIVVAVLLIICCACVGWWTVADSLF